MAGARILLAEDEPLIRMMLAEALTDDGFEVIEAADAGEALTALREAAALALLVTDIQMPGGMNGFELATAARAMFPDLPVLFTSGRPPLPGQRQAAREAFVAKPYLPSDISATARRLIAG